MATTNTDNDCGVKRGFATITQGRPRGRGVMCGDPLIKVDGGLMVIDGYGEFYPDLLMLQGFLADAAARARAELSNAPQAGGTPPA